MECVREGHLSATDSALRHGLRRSRQDVTYNGGTDNWSAMGALLRDRLFPIPWGPFGSVEIASKLGGSPNRVVPVVFSLWTLKNGHRACLGDTFKAISAARVKQGH